MKRSTKLLSVLLALLLTFSSLSVAAYSANYTADLSAAESAKLILDYADAYLAEKGFVQEISVLGISLGKIDATSVDKLCSTLYKTITDYSTVISLAGSAVLKDLKDINVKALKDVKRSDGDLSVIYALVQFAYDNSVIVQKMLVGELDCGSFIDSSLFNFDCPKLIKEIIYSYLLTSQDGYKLDTSRKYKNYTADQLMNAAVQDFIVGLLPAFDDSSLLNKININEMSFYAVFTNFFSVAYEEYMIGPLNTSFKKVLAKLCEAEYDEKTGSVKKGSGSNGLYNIINWNYRFTETTYNFEEGFNQQKGLVGQANDLICSILKTILTPTAYAELGLTMGSNSDLQNNLEKIFRYILPLCPKSFFYDGFDMNSVSASAIKDMKLDDMAALTIRAFLQGYNNDIIFPDGNMSLTQLAVVVGCELVAIYIPQYTYDSLIYTDASRRKMQDKTDEQWQDVIMDMLVDNAVRLLDKNTTFKLSFEQAQSYKKAGWTWEHFLDEIVDWGLDYMYGILPAVEKIPASSRQRGKLDDIGPWYKMNVILNALLPLEFLSGVSKEVNGETFVCDFETLIKDGIVGNVLELNVKGLLDLFAENDNTNNLFNENLVTAILKLASRIINGALPGTIPQSYTKDFATLLRKDNFQTLVVNLLRNLNEKKTKIIPAALPIVASLMYDTLIKGPEFKPSLALEEPVAKVSNGKADFRIIYSVSQADAESFFGISSSSVASGYLSKNGVVAAGVIMAKTSYMKENGLKTLIIENVDNKNIFNVKSSMLYTDNAKKDGKGYYYFAATVKDATAANWDTQFFAVGYVSYMEGGVRKTVYTAGNKFIISVEAGIK